MNIRRNIILPSDLDEAIQRHRERTGERRSALVVRALRELLEREGKPLTISQRTRIAEWLKEKLMSDEFNEGGKW